MAFCLLLLSVEGLARGNGKTTYASIGFARGLTGGFVSVVGIHDFSVRRENGKPPYEEKSFSHGITFVRARGKGRQTEER